MTRWLTPILALCIVVLPPVATLYAAVPGDSGPMLLVHAPWADGSAIAYRAGGRPLGPVRAPMGTLADSDDPRNFARLARAAGAWVVLPATALLALCVPGSRPPPNSDTP